MHSGSGGIKACSDNSRVSTELRGCQSGLKAGRSTSEIPELMNSVRNSESQTASCLSLVIAVLLPLSRAFPR